MKQINKGHIKLFFRVLSWMYKKNSHKVFLWDTGFITTGVNTMYETRYPIVSLFNDLKDRGVLILEDGIEDFQGYNGSQMKRTGFYVSFPTIVSQIFDRDMIDAVGSAAEQSKEHFFFTFDQVSLMLKCFKQNKKGELFYDA